MTRKEFAEIDFEELCERLVEQDILTTRESLLDYVKYCIDEDFLPTARDIINYMVPSNADYFIKISFL